MAATAAIARVKIAGMARGDLATIFHQMNAPGGEAENKPLFLSDFNETYCADSSIPLTTIAETMIQISSGVFEI